MFVLPAATPNTWPVAAFTVAAAVLLLLHVPPDVAEASVKVTLAPGQTALAPEIEPAVTAVEIVTVALVESLLHVP